MREYNIFDVVANKEVVIRVGSNDKDNWKLIDDADPNDLWFHIENLPSPHVIVEIPPNSKVSSATIQYAGALCVKHSKYSNVKKNPMIYTEVSNLKKGKSAGSVMLKAKPTKMTIST